MLNRDIVQQKIPKNRDSKKILSKLQVYLNIFCIWFVIEIILKSKSALTSIYSGFLLFNGIRQLSSNSLAIFVVMKIFTVLAYLDIYDKFLSGKMRPKLYDYCFYFIDILVAMMGVWVSFKGYQCFRAEEMGFGDRDNEGGFGDGNFTPRQEAI